MHRLRIEDLQVDSYVPAEPEDGERAASLIYTWTQPFPLSPPISYADCWTGYIGGAFTCRLPCLA